MDYIALIRGINVGRAKRIQMSSLRGLMVGLGFTDVATVLNSGNVLFSSPSRSVSRLTRSVEGAISVQFGFSAPVIVVTGQELSGIIEDNRLIKRTTDPSKHLVAFAESAESLARVRALQADSWAPEALAVGRKAAYLWCAQGILESRLMRAFVQAAGEGATTRNWSTVLKIQAALRKLHTGT